MIPEFCILQWRKEAPWKENYQVEQDLIISRALIDLYSNSFISKQLAFRGGTALNKLFIKPAARYSEDIDLVQLKEQPIGETINAIRSALHWLGEPQRKLTERSAKIIYRFTTIDNVTRKLKIEINTTEHFRMHELERVSLGVKNPWFTGEAAIITYNLNELIGTKLRALYQRRKGRDLFDMWVVLKNNMIDCKAVVHCFLEYCGKDGQKITRAIFEKSFNEKLQHKEFGYDIMSLLPHDIGWSIEEAEELIRNKIIELLPGEPYKEGKSK
jgi:predicted nucleotidyltransferase component of viral defense system